MSRALHIVADENIPALDDYFGSLGGIERVDGRSLSRQQLLTADILLTRSVTQVDAELLEGTAVRFVATATIGTDHLDIDYLAARGIAWANAPGCNAASVADYVTAALCSVEGLMADLLSGRRRIAIAGLGNVGGGLYRRLLALGIEATCFDPLLAGDCGYPLASFDRLQTADVICLHAPLTAGGAHPSRHLFSSEQLQQLTSGALLLNAGRGAVVDNMALSQLLGQRADVTAILDVWEGEPAIDAALMAQLALGTPHIAGYSLDGKRRGTQMIYQACCQFLGLESQAAATDEALLPLQLLERGSDIERFIDAVLRCYDPRQDDRRLRDMLAGGGDKAVGFDGLRKNYPERREFSRFAVSGDMTVELARYLKAVGFIVAGED